LAFSCLNTAKKENTYAYFSEGQRDDTAKVKITNPGLCMVRMWHTTPEHTEDYDRYVGPRCCCSR